VACAWLIRRYIDADAEFMFVGDPDEVPPDATPFDMPGVELSHHRSNCSFESFLERYQLEDPVLVEIARIVHEADLADERFHAPEAPGMDVLIRGLSWCWMMMRFSSSPGLSSTGSTRTRGRHCCWVGSRRDPSG